MKLTRLTLAAVLTLGACGYFNRGGKSEGLNLPLTASPTIPSAEGTVTVAKADDGNTHMDVTVHHMAPPERVTAGATSYVVWVRSSETNQQPQNVGSLAVDRDLNATLSTVTPLRQFDVFVTAEPTRTAAQPTGQPLMQTRVYQP
jgi:hypothetical protein